MRKKILKIYAVTLSVGLAYYILIRVTGIALPCFYYTTTGLLCPGCGTTRMFLSLARLDIAGAFSYNPAVFLLLIFWNTIALLCFWGKPAFVRSSRFLYVSFWLSVAALWIFCLLRNIT